MALGGPGAPLMRNAVARELYGMVRHDEPCFRRQTGAALVRRGWATDASDATNPCYLVTPKGIREYLDHLERTHSPGLERTRELAVATMAKATWRQRAAARVRS